MKATSIAIAGVKLEIVLWSVGFLTPLLLTGPQWMVGSVVNASLILGARTLSRRNLVFLSVLPSIGAVGHGVLFGASTNFLLFFLPFIWIGNFVYASLFKLLVNKTSAIPGMVVGSVIKVMILYGMANVFVATGLVPRMFLVAMGAIQLYTALAGGTMGILGIRLLKLSSDE